VTLSRKVIFLQWFTTVFSLPLLTIPRGACENNSFDFSERLCFDTATVTKIKISPGTPNRIQVRRLDKLSAHGKPAGVYLITSALIVSTMPQRNALL